MSYAFLQGAVFDKNPGKTCLLGNYQWLYGSKNNNVLQKEKLFKYTRIEQLGKNCL